MNNYVNIDRVSALLIAFIYISITTTIFSLTNPVAAILLLIVYNTVFLYIPYKFKLSKNMSILQVSLIVITTVLFIITKAEYSKYNGVLVVFAYLCNIFFIFSLFKLHFHVRNIYKYSYIYVNKNKFKPRPFLLLFIYILLLWTYFFSLAFLYTEYIMTDYIMNDYLAIIKYFIYVVFSFIYIYLYYRLLHKYKSAYVVLYLSRNRKIHVSSLINQNSTDIYELFKNQVEPYVYYAHYNEENNVITFDDEDDILKSNENNEVLECNLDKSINVINSLLADEKSHEIAGILKSIIDKLNKINNMHQEKHQFNKYIHHINERYIPYIKSLVQAYYNNMQLDLDLTKTMQEKIILSLEKINDTFEKSVQEMYNKNMLELESYMQAIDIMLNYKNAGSKA